MVAKNGEHDWRAIIQISRVNLGEFAQVGLTKCWNKLGGHSRNKRLKSEVVDNDAPYRATISRFWRKKTTPAPLSRHSDSPYRSMRDFFTLREQNQHEGTSVRYCRYRVRRSVTDVPTVIRSRLAPLRKGDAQNKISFVICPAPRFRRSEHGKTRPCAVITW